MSKEINKDTVCKTGYVGEQIKAREEQPPVLEKDYLYADSLPVKRKDYLESRLFPRFPFDPKGQSEKLTKLSVLIDERLKCIQSEQIKPKIEVQSEFLLQLSNKLSDLSQALSEPINLLPEHLQVLENQGKALSKQAEILKELRDFKSKPKVSDLPVTEITVLIEKAKLLAKVLDTQSKVIEGPKLAEFREGQEDLIGYQMKILPRHAEILIKHAKALSEMSDRLKIKSKSLNKKTIGLQYFETEESVSVKEECRIIYEQAKNLVDLSKEYTVLLECLYNEVADLSGKQLELFNEIETMSRNQIVPEKEIEMENQIVPKLQKESVRVPGPISKKQQNVVPEPISKKQQNVRERVLIPEVQPKLPSFRELDESFEEKKVSCKWWKCISCKRK